MDDTLLPLNAICPYYTMFPVDFPLSCLEDAPAGSVVYDPFCGRGTTNLAARMRGLRSFGVDLSPVAVAIAQAKLVRVHPHRIVRLAEDLLENEPPGRMPGGEFWRWAYHGKTLRQILKLRNGLSKRRGKAATALRAIILGALHGPAGSTKRSYFSNQMQRTFAPKPDYAVRFWKRNGMVPEEVDVVPIIEERAWRYYGPALGEADAQGRIVSGDARKPRLKTPKISHIITSPPYYGMRTYIPDQWLRAWFLGGPARPSYRQKGQLGGLTLDGFIRGLSDVWTDVARRSRPGAMLAIRFGALGSKHVEHVDIILKSLKKSGVGWEVVEVRDAGVPRRNARQATQMGVGPAGARMIRESDIICRLVCRKRR